MLLVQIMLSTEDWMLLIQSILSTQTILKGISLCLQEKLIRPCA